MARQTEDPKPVIKVTFSCDRCGKTDTLEFATDNAGEVREIPTAIPDGWVEAHHPDGGLELLTFDKRACTSTWFAKWVREKYGVPEPGPRRTKAEVDADAPDEA